MQTYLNNVQLKKNVQKFDIGYFEAGVSLRSDEIKFIFVDSLKLKNNYRSLSESEATRLLFIFKIF